MYGNLPQMPAKSMWGLLLLRNAKSQNVTLCSFWVLLGYPIIYIGPMYISTSSLYRAGDKKSRPKSVKICTNLI